MRQDAAQANYNRYWRATNARMAALQNVTPEEARRANGISGAALVIVVILMIIAYACGLMPGQNAPPNPMDYHPNQGVTFAPNNSTTGLILRQNPIAPGGGCYGCPSFGPGSGAK